MAKADLTENENIKTYRRNSRLRNITVIAICIFGMGLSLFLFRLDLANTQKKLEEQPVGFIHWANKSIHRESSRFFFVDRPEKNSQIFSGDTINSAAQSGAKINFVNGEIVELFENTSIRIRPDPSDSLKIELIRGQIHVLSGRFGMEIFSPESTVRAASAQSTLAFSLQTEPRTSADIMVNSGITVNLFHGSASISLGRESILLTAGKIYKISNEGVLLPAPPAMMVFPRNGSRLLRNFSEKAPVKFQWQKVNNEAELVLEIAETVDFANPLESWQGKEDYSEMELSGGFYFWRIYRPGFANEADMGRLEIAYNPAPRALSPVDGSTVNYFGDDRSVLFSWSVSEEASSVLLEVSDNPEMKRPRLRQLINRTGKGSGFFISSTLGDGKWYWRVHPVYPGGVSGAETLATPLGTGYWRIRPLNTDLIVDESPSPVSSFTLSGSEEPPAIPLRMAGANIESGLNPRLVFPPDNHSVESSRTPDLFFSWKNPRDFKARFQLGERSDFAGNLVLDERVDLSYIRGPFLKPGTYYWRVTGLGPEGTGNSLPTRLVVLPSLASPVLESPWDNERLRIEEGKAVTFAWERMNYASYYRFRLFLEGRDYPISEINSLRNNSVMVFFDRATAGQFTWTVQGFTAPTESSSIRSGLIASGRFTVTPQFASSQDGFVSWTVPRITNIQSYAGDVHSPITLLYPPSGMNIPGINALRSPMEARWRTEEPLRNVQLIVSRAPDPAGDPRAIVRDAGRFSATFPSLSEGIWYWTIRGDTGDQRGATPGDASWINILPIPQLSAPAPIQPEEEAVIGIARLTRERNVTFLWGDVPGANTYIFSLFRDGNPPTLVVSQPTEEERVYVLENLSLLNEGKFLWQVEAVSRNDNGIIEQRGAIQQNSFTIEIQRSTELQTHSQGTMYGQ